MNNEFDRRVRTLKSVEVLCYSICYHLLREELAAAQAAREALVELYRDERFWLLPAQDRDNAIRKIALHRSFEQLKKER